MLKKLGRNTLYATFYDETKYTTGTICGVNIKPIKVKKKNIARYGRRGTATITKWGVFIHIRMNDGSQYDAVWELDKTYTMGSINELGETMIPKRWKPEKPERNYSSVIPVILTACGVNEWVELIGTEIRIGSADQSYPAVNGFAISPTDGNLHRWFCPDYYEIHQGV